MIFQIVIVVLLLCAVALLGIILKKITHIDIATWDLPQVMDEKINIAESRLYRQLEAFHALNALIHPVMPLPPMRGWAGSPDFLLELARAMLLKKPQTVVECSSGASTIVAARCCQLNGIGHVYSLEHEDSFAEATRTRLREAGLEGWATVIDAPLRETEVSGQRYPWYDLSKLPEQPIELMVVDGPPASIDPLARYPAGPRLLPRLAKGALVLVDDADRSGEKEMLRRWHLEFAGLASRTVTAEKGLVILENTIAAGDAHT